MTLLDLLKTLGSDTLIGIWDIDSKHAKCPLPQHYQMVKNVPFGKIRNLLDCKVMCINVADNGGLLVRVVRKKEG